MAWSLLGSSRNGQAALYLLQKHYSVKSVFTPSLTVGGVEMDRKHVVVRACVRNAFLIISLRLHPALTRGKEARYEVSSAVLLRLMSDGRR